MKKRILLFDDDYVSMQPFKVLLERREFQVVLSAAQLLLPQLAKEQFDLICVDYMIHRQSPDEHDKLVDNVYFENTDWKMTGQEFLRRLRRGDFAGTPGIGTPATVPAIVISATADPQDKGDADYVFEKPFDTDAVLSAISKLL